MPVRRITPDEYGPAERPVAPSASIRRARRSVRRWRRAAFWLLSIAVLATAGMVGAVLPRTIDGVPAMVRAAPEAWARHGVELPTEPPPPSGLSAEHQFDPNSRSAGTFTGEFMYRGMNTALAARDHDAFFAYVQGDAVAPLQLWWANMTALGVTSGGIGPLLYSAAYAGDVATVRIRLGGVFPYAAQRPADAPFDPGRTLASFMIYTARVAVYADGAGGRIETWASEGIAAPWDSDELYAARGDSVVVAGPAGERPLIDATLAAAQTATDDVLAWYRAGIGETPTGARGFVVFVTADAGAFGRWMAAPGESWDVGNIAGMTFGGWRWSPNAPDPAGADGGIAFRGMDLPVITVGPLALGDPLEVRATIVHEEVHALQMTDNPLDADVTAVPPGSAAAVEGWGRYAEDAIVLGGFATSRSEQALLRACVRSWFRDDVPGDDEVYSADPEQSFCSYQISASMYAYAAEQGRDVFAAAADAYTGRSATPFAADAADIDAWARWLRDR